MQVRGNVEPVACRTRHRRLERVLGIVEDVCVHVQLALRMLAAVVFVLVVLAQSVPHIDVSVLP